MDVYVYSDESGVFDSVHNDYFVFGGIIFFDKKTKILWKENLFMQKTV